MSKLGYTNPEQAPTKHPSMYDIAWAAGIYEGEGTCKNPNQCFSIAIAQKDPWLPTRLQELFGGRVGHYVNSGIRPGTKLYHWVVYGARARGFAMTIFTFLSPRRRAQIRAKMHTS